MMTRRLAAAYATITISAAAAAGCGGVQPQHPRAPRLTSSQVAVLRSYGSGDTAFGLNVLSALCAGRPGDNVVISPVSLATGLSMAYLGARGKTAADIARVLHLPAGQQSQVAGLGARWALLRSAGRPGVKFAASNRIWADPSLRTNPAYVAALRSAYQAALARVPLLSDPQRARQRINSAIARETRGHIPRLLPPGSLGQIGWVLTDAMYLNARWQHPFDHALTARGPFAGPSGPVSAEYLNGGAFTTATVRGWTAVNLPYRGGRLSMVAVLPPPGSGAGCRMPAAGAVGAIAARLATSKTMTDIALPKVSLSSSESLNHVLRALGMGLAFSDRADFAGLSPQACCIGFVQHAATLAVAEKGTIASAATAVGVVATAGHITLTFNRPYLLILRDAMTGEPLMLAWVANPASR
jgi:serpin B